MLKKMAQSTIQWLMKKTDISPSDFSIYAYGAELAIYSLLSTCILLLVGCITHNGLNTIFIISFFYILQTVGGGFHANSHTRCLLTMVICLILALYMIQKISVLNYELIVSGISFWILLKFPLVIHDNKRYLYSREKSLIFKSKFFACFLMIIILFCLYFNFPYTVRPICWLGCNQ